MNFPSNSLEEEEKNGSFLNLENEKLKNNFQNNSFDKEKKENLMNINSNLYFNVFKNNQNISLFQPNEIKYGNLYNEINNNNSIIPNLNNYNINNYQIYSYYINNLNNNSYLYVNDFNNIINKIPIINNIYNQNINNKILNQNCNNFKKLNELNNINYYFVNSKENKYSLENTNFDSTKNDYKINNYLSKLNQSEFFNNYLNNNNKKIQNNENMITNKNNANKINNYPNNNNIDTSNKNDLSEFIKYINKLPMELVNYLCTPKGILEIQKKIEKSNNYYKLLLVNYLNKQGLSKIMKNTYGNYFFQQLIKNNENSVISLIISYISEDFIDISKDFSGTFSLQALLEEISSYEEEQKILNCIKKYEMEMAYNKNATHVLQKIVLLIPDRHRIYLNEIILNNFIELCLDSYGICLIKIFMKTNTLIDNKKRIKDKIINNFLTLAESPFGNYGIQYLMEIWNQNDLEEIKEKILDNINTLSLQQFSSNVIEKAIELFNEENRIKIIKKICFDTNFIITLLNNKFGKFVFNKALKYIKFDLKNELEIYLINEINKDFYKNKDKNKIKKLLMKLKNIENNKDKSFNNINSLCNNNLNFNNNIYKNENIYNNALYNSNINY